MIPGRTLHRLAASICNAKTLERIIEPAIADLQKEYAVATIRSFRRAAILVNGYAAILSVVAICAISISPAHGDDRMAVNRVFVWCIALVSVTAALLVLPRLFSYNTIAGWVTAVMVLPQTFAVAIPIGVAFGIAFGLSGRPSLNVAKVMLLGALAVSALSFGILVWAMPAANQAFTEITVRELRARGYQGPITGLQKGYNEMSFSELRAESARFTAQGDSRQARQYEFRLHFRIALAAATLALASVLLAARVNHRAARGLLAAAACLAYWVLMFVGESASRRGYLPQPIGAWLPNLALIATALIVASSSSSRLRGSMETSVVKASD